MGSSERDVEGYRWSCPICGTSRVIKTSFGPQRAIEGLRAHLEIYDGDGHGPENQFPDIDRQGLEDNVVPLGGEEVPKSSDEVRERTK